MVEKLNRVFSERFFKDDLLLDPCMSDEEYYTRTDVYFLWLESQHFFMAAMFEDGME